MRERSMAPTARRALGAVRRVLSSPGRELDPAVRGFMEERFPGPVSRVPGRVQTAPDSLAVGAPGDRYEREADHLADRVAGPSAPAGREAPPGFDFSRVRVHTGPEAAEAARGLSARAFTVGHHVVFDAGQYAPGTAAGRHLLAHELAHVAQQDRAGAPALVQRKITVLDPDQNAPYEEVARATLVERLLGELCPSGGWKVDPTSGEVSSRKPDTFCAQSPAEGRTHFRGTGTPTSCRCLCDLTGPDSPDVRVHVTDILVVNGKAYDLSQEGEGTTVPNNGGFEVGISGRVYEKIRGVGSTNPVSGTNPHQILRDPAWLIFGHELCGHARLGTEKGGLVMHSQSPEGDRTSVDVENRIRREHSTIEDNLGVRQGEFFDGTGRRHIGSVYKVSKGETLSEIAVRCGLSQAEILTRVFREDGSAVTEDDLDAVRAEERLMIEGIQWHEVFRGESMPVIARMWGVPEAALRRANPHIDPDHMRAGQRLLIPVA